MPTITTIALENLLEPRVRDSAKKPPHVQPGPITSGPKHLYISPALYSTPHQSPIPDHSSPDPPSPSPYVINLKRRRGLPILPLGDGDCAEEVGENFGNEEVGGEDEAMSVGSEVEVEVSEFQESHMESRSFVSAQGEFFDAIDDFSSDGSISNIPSSGSRIESELHTTRLSLLEEIEKRKAAEENLVSMRIWWEEIRSLMLEAGLTFPSPPVASDSMQLENNSLDQISQEFVVTRFVAEAIGRGQARAEAEEATLAIIESKDQEILRLRDRLQYYETVNHEMSQRKLVEVARRHQERKTRRRRWVWSLMGLSVAIGASLVAYTYIPHNSESLLLLESVDSTDASSVSAPESS